MPGGPPRREEDWVRERAERMRTTGTQTRSLLARLGARLAERARGVAMRLARRR
jgi:hypothetical protein